MRLKIGTDAMVSLGLKNMLETNHTDYLLTPFNWSTLGPLSQVTQALTNRYPRSVSVLTYIVLDEKYIVRDEYIVLDEKVASNHYIERSLHSLSKPGFVLEAKLCKGYQRRQ